MGCCLYSDLLRGEFLCSGRRSGYREECSQERLKGKEPAGVSTGCFEEREAEFQLLALRG